ncbi:hypothetical protein WJX84_012057 [Apatococcus fuscideae]|uniref:Sucrose-phosphatase n=1 Tax=Apatococcus fuscideae TaxID=2026836 RepID=A0AAW1SX75_9CHLO
MAQDSVLAGPYRFVLVSDLDWTMVDHSDKANSALLKFNDLWKAKLAQDSLLVFSTGRSHKLFEELKAEVPLLNPDVLVCSVGTEIFYESISNGKSQPEVDQEWVAELDKAWDREAAIQAAASVPELHPQAASEQRPHKLSYNLQNQPGSNATEIIQRLQEALDACKGLKAQIIYSGGVDVDILPLSASKGKALDFLLQQMKKQGSYPRDGVLVNGDSGNDIELFVVKGVKGCIVSNAHAELRQWHESNNFDSVFLASQRGAGGIMEAIGHFHLLPAAA